MANGYDTFSGRTGGLSDPADTAEAITPHDTNPLSFVSKAIFVGTGGNITLRAHKSAADVVLKNLANGAVVPIRASHVRATGTTATDLVLLV